MAKMLKADSRRANMVIGHYAYVRRSDESGRWHISRGDDMRQDQSYARSGASRRITAPRLIFHAFRLYRKKTRAGRPRIWTFGCLKPADRIEI